MVCSQEARDDAGCSDISAFLRLARNTTPLSHLFHAHGGRRRQAGWPTAHCIHSGTCWHLLSPGVSRCSELLTFLTDVIGLLVLSIYTGFGMINRQPRSSSALMLLSSSRRLSEVSLFVLDLVPKPANIYYTAVFEAVDQGSSSQGVCPIENSTNGPVKETNDCFVEFKVERIGKIQLDIGHALLRAKDASSLPVKKIYSHEQVSFKRYQVLRGN